MVAFVSAFPGKTGKIMLSSVKKNTENEQLWFLCYVLYYFMNLRLWQNTNEKTVTEANIYFQRLKMLGALQWKYKYLLLEEINRLECIELITIVSPLQQGKETLHCDL